VDDNFGHAVEGKFDSWIARQAGTLDAKKIAFTPLMFSIISRPVRMGVVLVY
jgi:hypothetical protein